MSCSNSALVLAISRHRLRSISLIAPPPPPPPTPLVPPVPRTPPAPPSTAGPAVGKVLGKSDDRSNRWLDLFDINRKMIREKRLRTTKLTTDGSKLKIKGPKYVFRVPNS